ncbi:hypothetical protein [Amycolatopsis sp. H20-H5]|uniref:hypothetical protein n=1 Tax=Amycolatopsis sp. H20-H5 TaxID=3046309 RepID=UPI002DBCE6B3|nr:hypothetical protein [Amycolatopsis sp. H20-H5]MEC3981405.1 hypothetical protein [Amycolatopsis sp. H20-H5]
MQDQDEYDRYRGDAALLTAIGGQVAEQVGRLTVRLPKPLAESAVAAWDRDETAPLAEETAEQAELRDQAAELALIGLAITQRGRWEGEELVVDLDVVSAGVAVRASTNHS